MLTVNGELYTSGCGEQGQLGRVAEHFANRGGRKGLSMSLHFDYCHYRNLNDRYKICCKNILF